MDIKVEGEVLHIPDDELHSHIGRLRDIQMDAMADLIQFDDGGRCRLCGRPAGGQKDHVCATPYGKAKAELNAALGEVEAYVRLIRKAADRPRIAREYNKTLNLQTAAHKVSEAFSKMMESQPD